MRARRLLSILIVLQARGRVSAEALARELEVSVRTIYRDIDQLGMAGVPYYAERGRPWWLRSAWRISHRSPGPRQQRKPARCR